MIKNYMEEYTSELLSYLLHNRNEYADICCCEECFENILATALTEIKPLYYTTKIGEVYSTYAQIALQQKNDVILHLVQAIEITKKPINHN